MLRGRDLGAKIRLLPLGLGLKQAELRHLGGRLLVIPGHLEQPASRVLGTLLVHLSVAISGHQRQSAIRGHQRSSAVISGHHRPSSALVYLALPTLFRILGRLGTERVQLLLSRREGAPVVLDTMQLRLHGGRDAPGPLLSGREARRVPGHLVPDDGRT